MATKYVNKFVMPNQEVINIRDTILQTEMETRLAGVKQKPKKVFCLGDSYSRGVGSSDNNGWPYYLQQLLPGSEFTVYGNSGAGFTAAGHSDEFNELTFYGMLQKAESELGPDLAGYDTFIVAGGWNDHSANTSELWTATETFVKKARELFSNAIVYVIPLSNNRLDLGSYTNVNYQIADAALKNGAVASYSSWQWLLHGTDNSNSDGIHPNAIGYELQANRMLAFILGGDDTVNTRLGYGFDYADGVSGTIRCGVETGFAWISGSFKLDSAPTSGIMLGTLPRIMGIDDNDVYIPCQYYQSNLKDIAMVHPWRFNATSNPNSVWVTTPLKGSWGSGATTIYVPPTCWPIGRS